MALVNQPAILPGEFAAEGDKNTIPANNDGLSGLASIAKGFPPITQQPLAQGGLPPQRQDFNGIFNLFSQFLLFAQNGGVYAYNNTLDYQPPAIIASDNVFYQCVAENGPSTTAGIQPVTNTAYWKKLVPDIAIMKGATSSAAGRSGLVPAPAAGNQNKALFGDATYKQVVQKVNGVVADSAGNVTIDIPEPVIASEAEAKAGTNNTKFMTPLRVKQAIDALADSGWTVQKGTNGWARDNSTGFTVQWGTFSTGSTSVTLPRSFGNNQYVVATNPTSVGLTVVVVTSKGNSSFNILQHDINSSGAHNYMYVAVGFS